MDFKKIKLDPSPSALNTTPETPRSTPAEKAPLDKAKYYEGATADIFIQDEIRSTVSEENDSASSTQEALPRSMAALSSSHSSSSSEGQPKTAMKTIELTHLSHVFQMPTQRVVSPQGSLLSQMQGEGYREEAALYAQYAAALAEMEKKKKRKKGWWRRIKGFFQSLFE